MRFVLDASVALAWVFPDESSVVANRLRKGLRTGEAIAPPLLVYEIGNALLNAVRRGRISGAERRKLSGVLADLPIEVDSSSAPRVWGAASDLAAEHGITIYDASYLELAVRTGLPLATFDHALTRAAESAGVSVPTASP